MHSNPDVAIYLVIGFMLLFMVVFGLLATYIVYHRKRAITSEYERKELALQLERESYKRQEEQRQKERELERATQRLEVAQLQLNHFKESIISKNKLIDELKNQPSIGDNTGVMDQLQKSVILTDNDWKEFNALFESIYDGYSYRLKNKVEGITPSELRMVVLAKLKFSYKDMADTLGVTPQASRVTWHRLRKKLNLEKEVSLEEFAASV